MLKTSLILALVLVSAPTAVLGQGQDSRGTRQQQDACARDVNRHCRKVVNQGDSVILQCLQQNRRRLSRACRNMLEQHGQ